MNFNSKFVLFFVVTIITLVAGRELAARVSNPIPVALATGAIVTGSSVAILASASKGKSS